MKALEMGGKRQVLKWTDMCQRTVEHMDICHVLYTTSRFVMSLRHDLQLSLQQFLDIQAHLSHSALLLCLYFPTSALLYENRHAMHSWPCFSKLCCTEQMCIQNCKQMLYHHCKKNAKEIYANDKVGIICSEHRNWGFLVWTADLY